MTASTSLLATSSVPTVAHSNDFNEEEQQQQQKRKQRILEEVRNVLLRLEAEQDRGVSLDNVNLRVSCIFRKRRDYLDILFPHLI